LRQTPTTGDYEGKVRAPAAAMALIERLK